MSELIFSVESGLLVQNDHILRWKAILKPSLYARLRAHYNDVNASASYKSGYDVPRGNDITVWVSNNLMPQTESRSFVEVMEYHVEVCRIGYGFATIIVKAASQEEAEQKALDEAGDHEFTEKSADYQLA